MRPLNKQTLRKHYREKRINLSTDQFHLLNRQLMEQVCELDMAEFATTHLFLPIEGNREPDTYAIAEWLGRTYPDMRVVLSQSDSASHRMHHFVWDDTTELKPNHWGIPEPAGGVPVSVEEIDAVFVPLLAFDIRGNRVGYGKGFYDRFLAGCNADTHKIGLSLFEAEPAIAGVDAFDVPLTHCITPTRTWSFNTVSGI